MKKVIYESFVRPHLAYCLSVWGAKKSQNITELQKLLKKYGLKLDQEEFTQINVSQNLKYSNFLMS